jgi:hypothetical protein
MFCIGIHIFPLLSYMAFCSAVLREHETGSSVFLFAVAQVRHPRNPGARTRCARAPAIACVTRLVRSFLQFLAALTFVPPLFLWTSVGYLGAAALIVMRIFLWCVICTDSCCNEATNRLLSCCHLQN